MLGVAIAREIGAARSPTWTVYAQASAINITVAARTTARSRFMAAPISAPAVTSAACDPGGVP